MTRPASSVDRLAPGRESPAAGPVRIGVSSCLLGERVRFDGGHKRDSFLSDTFGMFVEWVPVCPEVEAGLGTPRDAMRLSRERGRVRLITTRTGIDLTDRMEEFSRERVEQLARQDLCGYVLKKDSPSCGMERVKVYDRHGSPARSGRGIFAGMLLDRLPGLPVEEEGRLSDPRLRENFVERVFAYRRLRDLFVSRWRVGDLVRFHTSHKLTLMAHSPQAYQQLGRLVAGAKAEVRADLERRYRDAFMAALGSMATPRRHVNVLMHMAGYFKTLLAPEPKAELLTTIEDYRHGLVPLIVPLTLFRHHIREHRIAYLADQVYLHAHPKELMLRNHV